MKQNKISDKKSTFTSYQCINSSTEIEKKEQQWLKENKEAIDEHNKLVEKHGCFSDAYRRF